MLPFVLADFVDGHDVGMIEPPGDAGLGQDLGVHPALPGQLGQLELLAALTSADVSNGAGLSNGSVRMTSATNRRLRAFAVTQIAASFVLLAGASALIATLIALQRTQTGLDTQRVLAIDVNRRELSLDDGRRVAYECLLLATGAISAT